jgi:hypothetical protein
MLQHVLKLDIGKLQGARQFPEYGNPSNEAAADLRLRPHATDFGFVIRNLIIYNVWVMCYKLLTALLNEPHTNINKSSCLYFSSSVLKHKDVIYCYFGNSYFLLTS